MVLCASPPGLKQTFRCQHRDLILTRSAYDHKRVRPLKPMVGVVKSLGYYRRGPVGLVHTQKIEAQSEKPTWTKALEFTQFACPCGTDPRLLSGEQRKSYFGAVRSVDDPTRTLVPGRTAAYNHAMMDLHLPEPGGRLENGPPR